MKKISVFLSLIFLLSAVVPVGRAESEFMTLMRIDENLMLVSGISGGENVTVRSIYFGTDKPYFPNGIDRYEVSAEQIRSGDVNINYFNVLSADSAGRYSAQFRMQDYGYYLISAVSADGMGENKLYLYKASAAEQEPPLSAELTHSDKSKIFEIGGIKFILLNMEKDKSVLMPYSDLGVSNGYMLDEYLETVDSKLPLGMRKFVKSVYLPDSKFSGKFKGGFGIADSVGYFGNKQWRVLRNGMDNRDFSKYEQGNIEEKPDGIFMENIRFDGNQVYIEDNFTDAETVIEFIAPADGDYSINAAFSGGGSIKARLTALRDEKQFDNYQIAAVDYNGENISKISSVSLSAGDKLYLHLYSASGETGLYYNISCGGKEYNLNNYALTENKWWTAGGNANERYAYSMNYSDFGSTVLISKDKELFVRPVIEVDNAVFISNKINIDSAGGKVLSSLRENFSREVLEIYDEYELNTIFNESGGLLLKVLPFTDGEGKVINQISPGITNADLQIQNMFDVSKKLTFIIAAYSEEGRLIKTAFSDIESAAGEIGTFRTSIQLDEAPAGSYAKTFVWNSAEEMIPVSETEPKDPLISKLTDANEEDSGNWKVYVKPVGSTDYSEYNNLKIKGNNNISTGPEMPNISWSFQNSGNKAYIRPEKTGEQVIEYIVPHKGNWQVELVWKNVGVDNVFGGDGGSLKLSFLPKNETNDSKIFRTLGVSVSSTDPVSNKYSSVIAADGGDRILLSAHAGIDGYGDRWEVEYTISEVSEQGKIIGADYEKGLPSYNEDGKSSVAKIAENTVWIGVDGSFGDSEAAKKKILYFKKFIPNMGIVLMSANPQDYCNSEFYEENNIPVIVQSYGAGFEKYAADNNAWEWDWNNIALDASHWQDLSGSAHAFAMPHYATKEIFSRIAKSAAKSGYSGYGYPDCVWMWGARGISGYNPETVKAFVEDLNERDSGLKCDDGIWHFHDYYRYYTGSETLILPEDLNLDSWEEYAPLSQAKNNELKNSGADTTTHWAVFDMLCHYEWLKFAQYIADLSNDNGGICQIMINPEYYPDGVDYLFLNKLVNVSMTEEEFFGNTDYLDGAYYRYDYLTKFNKTTKTGGVMEAGSGGNGGAYYTNEIAYLTAFELGALESVDHLETDFMYQNAEFSSERDAQIMSYATGFSDAKSLGLKKREADFVLISSRNQSRPWAVDAEWKPWSLRMGYDNNIDFFLAKSGYNFNGISQEGIFDIDNEDMVVFSPHRVSKSVWNNFLSKIESGSIKKGVISAHRFDTVVTDKLKTKAFSEIDPEFNYSVFREIGLSGHINNMEGKNLTSSRKSLKGGLYDPIAGDETVLGFKTLTKTYPLLVKRNIGSGEMYVLLFDDSLSENYKITEIVYDYIMENSGIMPMFESVINEGSLIDGFTETEAHKALTEADLGASARIYQGGEMTVAGVQNSLARVNADSSLTSKGKCAPYKISGRTSVRILMSPGETYKYIAIPSMTEGKAAADDDGYVTLSFENTSHEIFFILPEKSTASFDRIKEMQEQWKTALKFED